MNHCDCYGIIKNPIIMKDKVEVYILDTKTNKMEKNRKNEKFEKKTMMIKKKVMKK